MTSLVVLTVLGLAFLGLSDGCSPLPGWVPQVWGVPRMAAEGPYVVYATGTGRDEQNNIATLRVHCVLREPTGESLPDEIYVRDMVYMHSCLANPEYQLNTTYIIALEKITDYFEDTYPRDAQYKNFEPDISTRNMFKATSENVVDDAFNVCANNPRSTGAGSCPVYNQRGECYTPPTESTTRATSPPPVEPNSAIVKTGSALLTTGLMALLLFV